jgi:type IV pilus assembly protein PilO
MPVDFSVRKQVILGALILLVLADVALGVYSWQLASAPQTPQEKYAEQVTQLKVLKGDIDRAQKIRNEIPSTQKDCDRFEQSLFPKSTGYSSVTSELGEMAKKAGVQLEDVALKQVDRDSRKIMEVVIDANVNGDYKNVVAFLNAVQRTDSTYAMDSLTLGSENSAQGPTGFIRVAVHLKTYFRTTA